MDSTTQDIASSEQLPILYSFRRCPYAIRARLAIKVSQIKVELREVLLKDKPDEMLAISPKGTVPVLLLPNGQAIEESREIMQWALSQNDPKNWLSNLQESYDLIDHNDHQFKPLLDLYKYADRHPENSRDVYREQTESFINLLDQRLRINQYLLSDKISFADMAIFPFVRQFAFVDKNWFDQTPYLKLRTWLEEMLTSEIFNSVMDKYSRWKPESSLTIF